MSDIPPPPPAQPYGGAAPSMPMDGPTYASWLARVGANLLDGLVNFAVSLPLLVPGFALLFLSADAAAFDPEAGTYSGAPSPLGIGLIVLGYLAVFVFAIWYFVVRQGRTGQTLAK